jgi:hypothetical protein
MPIIHGESSPEIQHPCRGDRAPWNDGCRYNHSSSHYHLLGATSPMALSSPVPSSTILAPTVPVSNTALNLSNPTIPVPTIPVSSTVPNPNSPSLQEASYNLLYQNGSHALREESCLDNMLPCTSTFLIHCENGSVPRSNIFAEASEGHEMMRHNLAITDGSHSLIALSKINNNKIPRP